MKNITLGDLQTQIRQISDQENSGFIQKPELINYINQSVAELYDKLVESFDQSYFMTSKNILVKSGTESYNLPADFYKMVGLDLRLTAGQVISLERYSWNERNDFKGFYQSGSTLPEVWTYRLTGSKIVLAPIPRSDKTLTLNYIPVYKTLVNDTDLLDGINGWELYIIYDCAIKIMTKEETDASLYIQKLIDISNRIDRLKKSRDAGRPEKVVSRGNSNGRINELYR